MTFAVERKLQRLALKACWKHTSSASCARFQRQFNCLLPCRHWQDFLVYCGGLIFLYVVSRGFLKSLKCPKKKRLGRYHPRSSTIFFKNIVTVFKVLKVSNAFRRKCKHSVCIKTEFFGLELYVPISTFLHVLSSVQFYSYSAKQSPQGAYIRN